MIDTDKQPSMKKRMLIMLVAVGLLLGAIVGYQAFTAHMMAQFFASNAEPPATVTATTVTREPWQMTIPTVGSLRAVHGVELASEVAGIVDRLHFASGDKVDAGALLIELDAAQEQASLAALSASRHLAEINLKRDQQQFDIKAVSQAQLDASQAELDRLKAEEARARADLARKRLRAPFAGTLGVSTLSPGQYINPAEKLVSLQDASKLLVDFTLPQRQASQVHIGNTVIVNSDGGVERRASISAIDSLVDAGTRNVAIEAALDNADSTLLPGMFVAVALEVGAPRDQLTLPQTAVSYNPYGSTVFLVKPAEGDAKPTAQQVFVKTGDRRGDQIAIIDGVSEGDQVVTSGQMKLKNGTPLIIDNSVTPSNDIAPTPQEQ
jgi:membrane fusion protein (multidrug efflux system)